MENQELMRLCFQVAMIMKMAQNGETFGEEVVMFQNEKYLTPETVKRAVDQWNPQKPSLEIICSALHVGFKTGIFSVYQSGNIISYRQEI